METKTVEEWLADRRFDLDHLLESCRLDRKVLEAILHGRYTPSPAQRQRVAAALGVGVEQVLWGHSTPVSHLYGHGPQFGRTP